MQKYTITKFRALIQMVMLVLTIFNLRFTNLVCPKCENDKPSNKRFVKSDLLL